MTKEEIHEKNKKCSECNSTSVEACLKRMCPYYVLTSSDVNINTYQK